MDSCKWLWTLKMIHLLNCFWPWLFPYFCSWNDSDVGLLMFEGGRIGECYCFAGLIWNLLMLLSFFSGTCFDGCSFDLGLRNFSRNLLLTLFHGVCFWNGSQDQSFSHALLVVNTDHCTFFRWAVRGYQHYWAWNCLKCWNLVYFVCWACYCWIGLTRTLSRFWQDVLYAIYWDWFCEQFLPTYDWFTVPWDQDQVIVFAVRFPSYWFIFIWIGFKRFCVRYFTMR